MYIGLVLLDVVGSGCGALSCVSTVKVSVEQSWLCWMWLVAVVERCLVGCEHYEGFCSTSNKTRPIYTKCSNRTFVLLKMGIMMPEIC